MWKPLGTAALVALAGMQQRAVAAEADWLYFPMYERDTAHAVHLSALAFRADGLLASATRYPRAGDEPWTEEESRRGWYGYEVRLIDCETGFFVETRTALLDRDERQVASHDIGHAAWTERLVQQLIESRSHAWPSSRSEIFLACAAASSPTLKAERARQARAVQPLLTDAPITRSLEADSTALFARGAPQYDFSRLARRPPATAAGLFDQLRLQYVAWRQSIDKPYRPAAARPPAQPEEFARYIDEMLEHAGGLPRTLRVLGGGVIEYEQPWSAPWGTEPPRSAAQARMTTQTVRADCTSGLEVVLARHWRDDQGKALVSIAVPVKEALALAREAQQRSPDEAQDWRARPAADTACGIVKQAHERLSAITAPTDAGDGLPFGLTREALDAETTPAAMLLKIRAAVRSGQL